VTFIGYRYARRFPSRFQINAIDGDRVAQLRVLDNLPGADAENSRTRLDHFADFFDDFTERVQSGEGRARW
jgi:hypothetical protein